MNLGMKDALLKEAEQLEKRYELFKTVPPDYYEPGMMEFLDQSRGVYDEASGELLLQFEVRETRRDGRTEQIERVHLGDPLQIARTKEPGNSDERFRILTEKGKELGTVPPELAVCMASLVDEGSLEIEKAEVSYVESLSARSRHAKQAILFAKLIAYFKE